MYRALCVVIAACGTGRAEPTEPGSPHFSAASGLHQAVFSGDLVGLRTLATSLSAGHDTSLLPDGPHKESLAAAMTDISRAPDMDTAALAVGVLAGACGSCHKHHGVSIPAPAASPPEPDGSVAGDMQGHRYGAELMWSGLVGSNDALFARGVDALAKSTLTRTGMPADAKTGPVSGEVEIRLQDLAAHAARSKDPAERARTTGRVLATCHLCHRVTKGGPAPGATR